MGFYYFILLFIGILVVFGGLYLMKRSRIGSALLSFVGILLIGTSIFLFQPESSELIAGLLE